MSKTVNHSPAPWECETVQSREDRSAYAVVKDASGNVLFDTLNSDVAVIYEEYDERAAYRWDENGRANLTLAAAAPELLAACEALLADADARQDDQAAVKRLYEAWRMVRGAVAKAKGNSQ